MSAAAVSGMASVFGGNVRVNAGVQATEQTWLTRASAAARAAGTVGSDIGTTAASAATAAVATIGYCTAATVSGAARASVTAPVASEPSVSRAA